MDPPNAQGLRDLLKTQRIGSLGTLHEGEPYVSMVPFAILPGEAVFAIHVSRLAAHTKDMLEHPSVSLLVVAPASAVTPAQAAARMTIQADAAQLSAPESRHAQAKKAYLSRFPESEMMFELADFSLFALKPRSIRFVGGFAQAKTITPERLAEVLRSNSGSDPTLTRIRG